MKKNWLKQRNFWELLYVHTLRHIQVKYKQTFFGFIWALFLPTVVCLAGVLVRTGIRFISNGEIEISRISSVAVKALPWAFFSGGLKFIVNSLVANMGIIKKIYFPRIIYPFSYLLSSLFDMFVATFFFTFILTYLKVGVSWQLLWVPVLVLILVSYTAGLGMLLAAANLFYRDVKLIIDVLMTFAIFVTPVFYDASLFGEYSYIIMLNPVGTVLESLNSTVVYHQPPDFLWLSYATAWAVFFSVVGWKVFHKAEPHFADRA